ncbi:S9 family peptidase [Nannocystis punicea]|uniref:S9 family peptidase n=1 Tax=Nannocystis punicea TaxID=2995304 RepID=A0ABY7GVI3_9BACT|nr:S9 family peptidase [Nannocystis poenicansa]WAS90988.1 S9 family peptidase [Nannocystis poenicansa]
MSLRSLRLPLLSTLISVGCVSAPPQVEPPAPAAMATPTPDKAGAAEAGLTGPAAPVARKEPHVVELANGLKLVDEYHWMRRKDAPDVLDHLRAEDAYAEAMTAHLAPLREKLHEEMLGRLVETDVDVPYKDGDYLYYSRVEKGKQYPIHCRKAVKGGEAANEEILLDLNEIGKREKFVGLGPKSVSNDGSVLAYGIDTTGFRQFVLRFKDLRTGKELPERIERVTSVAFAKDGRTVFYTVEDPTTKRSHRLYRHRLGEEPAKDALVHDEKDERFRVHVHRSRSREIVFVNIESRITSEVRFVRADRPEGPLVTVEPREQGHEYSVEHRGKELLITTNSAATAGGAKPVNFRLVSAPLDRPGRASWKEVVPHRPGVMLEGADAFQGFTVLVEREDGVRHLRFMQGKQLSLDASHRVVLPEAVYSVWPGANPELGATSYRIGYESPITPETVYEYDPAKRSLTLRKRLEVPGGYDASRYEVRRVFATAKDGTKVPISVVARKGAAPDRKNPVHLYGYGSYGHSINMGFSSARISLLDRGVVSATAHVRGGGEMGKRWHEDGRMQKKMNTFTDFVAAAEALVAEGWADPRRIVIQGASAGGLLMGAVVNLRPDLFAGVVAEVPFVDVIHTMLDESLPLTVEEFEEWGNPKKPDELAMMLQYSPYDNIAPKAYPPVLVRTSYSDSQVMYWEPAKYVAKLRATKTDQNPVLLRIHLGAAGHGGLSGRYDKLRDTAFTYAWMLDRLGVKEP